jgi:hypothetical protein
VEEIACNTFGALRLPTGEVGDQHRRCYEQIDILWKWVEQTAQQGSSAADDPPIVLKARAFGCNEIKCMLEWSRNIARKSCSIEVGHAR